MLTFLFEKLLLRRFSICSNSTFVRQATLTDEFDCGLNYGILKTTVNPVSLDISLMIVYSLLDFSFDYFLR